MCGLELPDLETAIHQVYDPADVRVIGLHSGEDPLMLDLFVAQTGVTFDIVRDEGTLGQLNYPPGVGFPYPRDVVVGPDLTLRAIKNSVDVDEMTALIDELLEP